MHTFEKKSINSTICTLNNIPIGFNLVHNHPPNPAKLEVTKVLQHIKKRCRAETTPVPAIYKQEIAKLRTPEWNDDTQRMVEQLTTFPSLKSSLYRQREDLIPHLPTSLLNIDLQDEWTQTTEAERFLLINAGTYDKILVFATDNHLQHMAKNDNNTIYDDGTFCTCPSIFEQLYTLIDVPTGFCTITWEVKVHLYQILLTT
ncbi:unnamed protein product [Mytilus edulis]|uniref:Uncharacterized protein n=1 Tax=Mytilus edulis TaxID=6550 RepID=A0A8S3PZ59_MYTED|nr:unnamed protein product [Mytilus edulis]